MTQRHPADPSRTPAVAAENGARPGARGHEGPIQEPTNGSKKFPCCAGCAARRERARVTPRDGEHRSAGHEAAKRAAMGEAMTAKDEGAAWLSEWSSARWTVTLRTGERAVIRTQPRGLRIGHDRIVCGHRAKVIVADDGLAGFVGRWRDIDGADPFFVAPDYDVSPDGVARRVAMMRLADHRSAACLLAEDCGWDVSSVERRLPPRCQVAEQAFERGRLAGLRQAAAIAHAEADRFPAQTGTVTHCDGTSALRRTAKRIEREAKR